MEETLEDYLLKNGLSGETIRVLQEQQVLFVSCHLIICIKFKNLEY